MNYNYIDRIEQYRVKLNLSQSEMAKALHMSLSSYKRLVTGGVSTRMLEVPIYFHKLTGVSLYGLDTHISRQHKILSELQDLTTEQLDLIEHLISVIKK